MLTRIPKKFISIVLTLCMIVSMIAVGTTGGSAQEADIAETGNFVAEKAMEKAYDIGMRAVSCGLDAAADATGKSGKTGWETAISFVNDWVFKDASEVAIAEVEELCKEILHELDQIEKQIDNSMNIVDSMVSKSIIETAKQAVNTQWDTDVTGPLNTYGAKTAFDAYKEYVTDAIGGVKTKQQMQSELDVLIDDFYLMYNGQSQLGNDKRQTMFTSSTVNDRFEIMIKELADNLDKSGSVAEKSAYFAYMAYPFSHQQYTYVYNMMEKHLVYMLLAEMMYNEYLFQQGEYLRSAEGYGPDSAAYIDYENYQQRFYDLMMTNSGCVNEHVGNMLETKIIVDTASGISLGLEDYMKPEDAVSVPLTFPYVENPVDHTLQYTYHKSYDFWDEAVDMANAYDDDWSIRDNSSTSKADKIGETVWFKRVMTHSTYGSRVFYIIDPDKLDSSALNVRNYKNKIDLKGYADVHTPTCDYINLMTEMTDGVNTFGTTDTYDCASIAPLFAPNAFLANGNKLNNYLSGYLPTYEGNNYLLTPMRRYNSNKKGLKTSYVKYKIVDGNYAYASGVSIDGDDGQDEVDTSSFDNSETAYDKDRFTVILANKDEKSVYKQNVHAEVKGNDYSAIRIYTEDGGEYLDGGDSMEVESGKMLTIKLKANGFMLDSLTVTRNNGDKMSETLLESDDFSHLSTDSDGWFEFHYPMPYSDATFTLNATATPVMVNVRMGDIAHGSGSIKSFDEEQNTYVWIQEVEAQENFALDISFKIEYGYQFNGPVFYNDDTNQQISCSYRKVNSFVDFDNYTNYTYTVWVPGVNLRIEAAFDETLYTASLGTLEHCTGTMGYLQGNAYGIGNVHDTQETSISVSKAIRSVCAIITVEKGYTPVGKTVDSIISVTDAKTGEAVNVKVNLMIDVDEEMRPVYYAMFDMPQRNIVIDVVCEPSLTATLNTESFVYDSNNNPVCHALLQDPLTDVLATVVSLPDYGNFFRCYFYKDEYHDMSHLSIVGADTGMVYYDQDQPKDFTNREEDLNDNTGLVNFEVQQDGSCALAVMFMDGRLKTTPESLILTPTFVRNETPIPPTEAPTEAPIKYSATLSSFDGGTPTFNLGSVTVIRKAEESEEVPFYITAAPDYEVKELTIIGTGGTGITPQKTAEPYEDGENMIHSYSFEMPAEDVVIKGKLGQKETPTEAPTEAPRYFAVPDKTQFIRDSQGTEIAYIELKDPETNNYSKERIWFASDSNTIEGRFIYDDEYCPSHLKVIGKDTGTVFYDMDKSEDAYTFVCVTSDLAPFGEDLSVIPTFEKTVQPTEAPTEAPTETPTEAPTQPATEPDPSAHGIRTYEELVEFARLVNEDYANYGNANVWLENNIIAPADSEWTQGIGSLNDDKPFNGIFDGNGYCIIGLNINNSKYGSLFESVGEKGVIKDLMIFDTHFITEATFAAGIVISNEGTIDHCISGINVLGRTKITLPSGKKINPADYNSVITGTNSAGIALVNSGTITGCRNGSVVRGDYCAGIAALNDGSIYGSTNNGAIGTDTAECLASGGITVHNMGSIASSYNSGKLRCADKISMGYVTVYNSSDTVNNVFFNNVNSIPAIKPDEDTNVQLNDTNKLVENEVMLTQEFVETLAAVTDDSITWVRTKYGNSYFNQGYPIIQGRFLEQNTQYLTKDITISGAMHSSLKASATALDTGSEEYQALQAAADGELISAYAVSTTDKNGNFVPAELWTSGGMQITVALDGNDIAPTGSGDKSANRNTIVLIALTDDGEAVRIYPDRIENGKAVFTSVIPSDFAVAKVEAYKLGDADGDGEVDITDATTIQRFDVRMNIAPVTEADLLARADVDGDGEITIIDATLIQRYTVNMTVKYPIGKYI